MIGCLEKQGVAYHCKYVPQILFQQGVCASGMNLCEETGFHYYVFFTPFLSIVLHSTKIRWIARTNH